MKEQDQVLTSQEKHPISLLNCHACVELCVYSSHWEGFYLAQQLFSWVLEQIAYHILG
jgi:hypothetical protein